MSDLDDLLNSALDELEIQEKESPPVPPPKLTTTTTTTTTSTKTSSTTTTTTTTNNNSTTNVNNNNNNNNNNNINKDNLNLNEMMDMFKKVLGDDTIKQLNEGFDKGYDGDLNEGDLTEEDKKNIDEWAQKISTAFNTDDLNQYFEKMSQQNEFNINNGNDNNNNNSTDGGGINIDTFESSISDTLKNLADNASNKAPDASGMEEMLAELTKMFDTQGGDGEKFNDIFEESMEYMAKNYPEWIEKNKDKYSTEEVEKFRQQAELFNMLVNSKETDTIDEGLYTKMAELGNLPSDFCDEFLEKYESTMQKDEEEKK